MARFSKSDDAPVVPVHLYGWDARSQLWHGPNELGECAPDKRLLQALRATPGSSWYGPVNCCGSSGSPGGRFFALMHDLSDCAMAALYCDESKAGPAEILVVIPADRRAHLREEFTFEFLSFARFLGTLSAGAELQVHEGITAALASESGPTTCVFSISSGLLSDDLDLVVSHCAEKVASTLCCWLTHSEAPPVGQFALPCGQGHSSPAPIRR